jgi:hypothetical protein
MCPLRRYRPASRAFSLIEIMIAILFITIGFFGYVALHSRILHSGQKLEQKEVIRAGTDYFEALEVARISLGMSLSVTNDSYVEDPVLVGLFRVKTDVSGRNMDWIQFLPEEYRPGFAETLELSPTMLNNPYKYEWGKR